MEARLGRFGAIVKVGAVLLLGTVILLLPGRGPQEVFWRLLAIPYGLVLFIYLGFELVRDRGRMGTATLLFLVGLACQLLTFARLYQTDGVLCSITRSTAEQGLLLIGYESRTDIRSCIHLSVDVWTAGGYGSVMAKDSQGWLVAAEQLIGYSYMAIFMAILITILHQHVRSDRS